MNTRSPFIAAPPSSDGQYAHGHIMDRLKRETAGQHEQLEAQLDLLRPSFTLREYAGLLARFYGFYRPWEEAAWPILETGAPTLAVGRRKSPLLAEDLRFLGGIPEAIPSASLLPPLTNLGQALGSLYVLEGATLGGQILSRHFAQTLGLAREGLTFFRGYGERTGPMWKKFRDVVTSHAAPANEDTMVLSAVITFQTLSEWLTREDRHD